MFNQKVVCLISCVSLSGVLAVSAWAGAASLTQNYWQAVGGSLTGSWDDPDHWSLGAIGELQQGRFDLKNGQTNVVTYPAGEYTNAGEIFARGWDTRWYFQLVGTNTTYTMGGSTGGTDIHSSRPFLVGQGNGSLNFETSFLGPYSTAPIVMSNFLFKAVSADDGLDILFDGGLYDMPNCGVIFFVGDLAGMPNDRFVEIRNATMNVSYFKIAVNKAMNQPGISRVTLDHATVNSSGRFIFPEGNDGSDSWAEKHAFEFLIDNGSTFAFNGTGLPGCVKNGILTNKLQIITVDHGSSFVQPGSPKDFVASQGHYVFNIFNGSTARFGDRSIFFGNTGYGVTDVNISNAVWSVLGGTYFGARNSNVDPTSAYYNTTRANLNVYNGAITNMGNSLRFTSGGLKLVDSEFVGDPIYVDAVAAARAEFHADGGIYRFTRNQPNASDIWHDWDTATVGARGFTIDNTCADKAFSQDFADAPGEKGVLTLTGTKNFTLNSTNTTVSTVAVAGVQATFDDAACLTSVLVVTNGAKVVNVPVTNLTGLVLGDAATTGALEFELGKTIDIDGELVLANPVFTICGAVVKDVTNILFRATVASAETVEKWLNLNKAPFASAPSGCGLVFAVTEEYGRKTFTMLAREAATHEENLAEGTEERTDDILLPLIDAVSSTVGENATLTLSGTIEAGRFEKRGPGKVVLSNPNNVFVRGFGLYEGILGVTAAGALGYAGNGIESTLSGGVLELSLTDSSVAIGNPLRLDAPTATTPMVLKVEKDATIPVWKTEENKGVLLKTGAGTLTVKATANAKIVGNKGLISNVRDSAFSWTSPLVFAEDGRYVSGLYLGFSVTEGEVRFEGPQSVTLDSPWSMGIGGPVTGTSGRSAGVVIDGLTLNHRNSWGVDRLPLCSGLEPGVNCDEGLLNPYLCVTNHGTFLGDNIRIGDNLKVTEGGPYQLRPRLDILDGSTVDLRGAFYLNASATSNLVPHVNVKGGSSLYVAGNGGEPICLAHSATLTVDGSTVAANDELEPVTINVFNGWRTTTATLNFVNGSTFFGRIKSGLSAIYTHQGKMRMHFDDAEWDPVSTDYVFEPSNTSFKVEVSGRGVVLEPPAGGVWQWRYDTSGEGGLVMSGQGLLMANATNLLYTGVTEVASGTLDLEGADWTNRVFAGGGTLKNVSLTNPTLIVDVADDLMSSTCLTLGMGASLAGRVTVDLGRTEPGLVFDKTKPFAVLRYSGAAPEVRRWKLVGTGLGKEVRGVFVAADGVVTCTLANPSGLSVIVR